VRSQEDAHYSPQETAAVIRELLLLEEQRKKTVQVEAPESGDWNGAAAYAQTMFANELIDRRIDAHGCH
jgi:hypothetical protein